MKTITISVDQCQFLSVRPALKLGFALLSGGTRFVRFGIYDADGHAPGGVLGTATLVVDPLAFSDV